VRRSTFGRTTPLCWTRMSVRTVPAPLDDYIATLLAAKAKQPAD